MKKLKLKLDGIAELLTTEQMKKINGGYDGEYNASCSKAGYSCSVYTTSGATYSGYCGYYSQGTWGTICECQTTLGPYTVGSNGGSSYCN